MKKTILILTAVFALLSVFAIAKTVSADMAVPSSTKYFFQIDGQPYNKPLDFSYDCYGYESWPGDPSFGKDRAEGSYTPEKILSLPFDGGTMSCSNYGCEIEGVNGPYPAKYSHLDYCIFHITSEGKTFEAKQIVEGDVCSYTTLGDYGMICSTTINITSTTQPKTPANTQPKPTPPLPVGDVIVSPPLNPIPEPSEKNIFSNYTIFFLFALFFTVIIETMVLLAMLKLIWKKKGKDIKIANIIITGIIASTLTIPYLWFVLPDYLNGVSYLAVGEIAVVLIESVIIFWILKLKWPFALLLSFICNLISFLLGWLIMVKLL